MRTALRIFVLLAVVVVPITTRAQTTAGAPPLPAPTPPKAVVVPAQGAEHHLVSKFRGTDVIGPEGEKLGDVADVLFDDSGKIHAYVVAFGGFLGMGSKYVALMPASFKIVPPDKDHAYPRLRLYMSKDELRAAQNFAFLPTPKK